LFRSFFPRRPLFFLVTSWTRIVELQSSHKRLAAFAAAFDHRPLPALDQAYPAGNTDAADWPR